MENGAGGKAGSLCPLNGGGNWSLRLARAG
jgi:hypothetical protein